MNNGWLKWNNKATALFDGRYDKQLKDSLQSLIKPFLSNQNTTSNEPAETPKKHQFNTARRKLETEIAFLEQQKQEIEKQLKQKYAQLNSCEN